MLRPDLITGLELKRGAEGGCEEDKHYLAAPGEAFSKDNLFSGKGEAIASATRSLLRTQGFEILSSSKWLPTCMAS